MEQGSPGRGGNVMVPGPRGSVGYGRCFFLLFRGGSCAEKGSPEGSPDHPKPTQKSLFAFIGGPIFWLRFWIDFWMALESFWESSGTILDSHFGYFFGQCKKGPTPRKCFK